MQGEYLLCVSTFVLHPTIVGPLELANALAACCLSSRLSSQHRQWAAQQLVRTLAAHDRDNQSQPQTFADMSGDLRKCSTIKLEGHHGKVGFVGFIFLLDLVIQYDVVLIVI